MRFIAAFLTLALLLPFPAGAQQRHGRQSSEREHERDRDLCREPIQAAGDAFHLVRAARASAIKRWQEQVINVHGERFINYENARGPDGGAPRLRCDPARVGGGNSIFDLKRCVVNARPCREPAERDEPGDRHDR
ncbi:MAG: hypothetical protein ACLPWS_13695 [Rhodomicrobium sp.]